MIVQSLGTATVGGEEVQVGFWGAGDCVISAGTERYVIAAKDLIMAVLWARDVACAGGNQ